MRRHFLHRQNRAVFTTISLFTPLRLQATGSTGGEHGDSLNKALDALIDEKARPRVPLKPCRLLLPSFQPASHPVLLSSSSLIPTQFSAKSAIVKQLKNASQSHGFYSPLWVSEAAAARYELQLKTGQTGFAVRTKECGNRFVPLLSLKDGALIDFIGSVDVKNVKKPLSLCSQADVCTLHTFEGLTVISPPPPHLLSVFKKANAAMHSGMHRLRDTDQFLIASANRWAWAKGIWLSVSEIIEFYLSQRSSSVKAAHDVMDAATFMNHHVTASGKAASFRVKPYLAVLYNSEQFADNSMLINMTKKVIMENLKSIADQRRESGYSDHPVIPNVKGRPIDESHAESTACLLAEGMAKTSDISIQVPKDDLALVDREACLVTCVDSQKAQDEGTPSLADDVSRLDVELRSSRARYISNQSVPTQTPQGHIGDETSQIDTSQETRMWAEEFSESDCEHRLPTTLPSPCGGDSAEELDILSCRALSADDAEVAEERREIALLYESEMSTLHCSSDRLLISPLPQNSPEQIDSRLNDMAKSKGLCRLFTQGGDDEGASNEVSWQTTLGTSPLFMVGSAEKQGCEAAFEDEESVRCLTADDEVEQSAFASQNILPLRVPQMQMTASEMLKRISETKRESTGGSKPANRVPKQSKHSSRKDDARQVRVFKVTKRKTTKA